MTDTTIDLPSILISHDAWLRDEPNGKRADLREADLRGATGIISAGHPDGWLAYGWLRDGWLSVSVGCREMRLDEGRAYWAGKDDRREVLAALDYIEAVAKIRGWRIEV